MPFDVITFGSAIVDIFLWVEEIKGEKTEVKKRVIASGGGGTNTAVSFHRLGLKSAPVSRLGEDFFSRIIVRELKKENIPLDFLVRKKEETDCSVILVGPKGKRTIFVYRGETRLEIDDIHWRKLQARWFYLTSLEGNLDLAERLILFARKNEIRIAWNPGRRELAERKRVMKLANLTTVFNLNREEMEFLLAKRVGGDDFWEKAAGIKGKFKIVTDGRNGAYLLSGPKRYFLPASKMVPVDETGAGDAFGSGFVAGLIKGMNPKGAFDLAMRNAASVVQKIGAKKGLLKISK